LEIALAVASLQPSFAPRPISPFAFAFAFVAFAFTSHHCRSTVGSEVMQPTSLAEVSTGEVIQPTEAKPTARMRTMRKSFARYTGVHGFFSMKYSGAAGTKTSDEEATAELLRKRLELIQVARERR